MPPGLTRVHISPPPGLAPPSATDRGAAACQSSRAPSTPGPKPEPGPATRDARERDIFPLPFLPRE
eukprot:8748272-Pyramimonas_sp.AAC.1